MESSKYVYHFSFRAKASPNSVWGFTEVTINSNKNTVTESMMKEAEAMAINKICANHSLNNKNATVVLIGMIRTKNDLS